MAHIATVFAFSCHSRPLWDVKRCETQNSRANAVDALDKPSANNTIFEVTPRSPNNSAEALARCSAAILGHRPKEAANDKPHQTW